MGNIFECFSILSIVIACLGLFALISLSAEQRTKEIGIRKVLGATAWNVSYIFSKEFLGLIAASNVAAWPVTYYFMEHWLRGFAYRADLTLWPFFIASFAALCIAFLTVSYEVIRISRAKPVEALRYE
jgi:putative ABC transport system permease protein